MQAHSSLSHHGRLQAKTGAKGHPLNTRNLVSIQKSNNPIVGVLAYDTFRGVICRRERRAEKIRRRQEQLRGFDDWLLAHPMLSTLIAVVGALLILGLAILLKKLLGGD